MSAHEQVETPNWDTKQRCSCGAEYVSRAELWKHLAESLRSENARLREALARILDEAGVLKLGGVRRVARAALAPSPSETQENAE